MNCLPRQFLFLLSNLSDSVHLVGHGRQKGFLLHRSSFRKGLSQHPEADRFVQVHEELVTVVVPDPETFGGVEGGARLEAVRWDENVVEEGEAEAEAFFGAAANPASQDFPDEWLKND